MAAGSGTSDEEDDQVASLMENYEIGQFTRKHNLGQGAFGVVSLMTRKRKQYAIKALDKSKVQRNGKLNAVMRERQITDTLSEHRNFVDFYGTCQD